MRPINDFLKNRSIFNKLKSDESGNIIIIVAVSMVLIIGMLALVIDLGLAYLSTNQQQKAADAAVYSAGRLLPVSTSDLSKVYAIKDSAIDYADQNGFGDLTRDNVILGNVKGGQFTDIKVNVPKSVPMNFAKIFGVDFIDINRSATAKLSPVIRTTGVAPIGLTKEEIDTRIAEHNLTNVILKYGANKDRPSPSFFGALDLDGQGGGASDYRIWLTQGFAGEISVGDVLLEESGNMVGPTWEGFEERYSACTHFGAQTGGPGCTASNYEPSCPRIVKVPIYSVGTDNKTVIVKGFAAFLLESQTPSSDRGEIKGSFLNMVSNGAASGGNVGEGADGDYGLYNLLLSE